jgi:transcriptional regulator with XRE-family HTH domain
VKKTNELENMKIATGRVIKRHRERIGWDQHELGFVVYDIPDTEEDKNRAQQRVKTIESGRQPIRITDLAKYAEVFRVKLQNLINEIMKESNNLPPPRQNLTN